MDELKKFFESLDLKKVKTFIQSGNVIFDSTTAPADISSKLEKEIKKTFGIDITVVIRTPDELKKIISDAPYMKEMMKETKLLYIMLLSGQPNSSDLKKIEPSKYLPDQFFLLGKEMYLYLPNGAGRTKLSNNFFENKLKVSGTSRNWNTINELIRFTE